MIGVRRCAAGALAAAVVVIIVGSAAAEPPDIASLDPDRRTAYLVESKSFEKSKAQLRKDHEHLVVAGYAEAYTNAEAHAKYGKGIRFDSIITSIRLLGQDTVKGPVRRALVTRFDYPTGLTFQSVVDLQKKVVLEPIEIEANYPTPLAPREVALATVLVSEKTGTALLPAKATVRPFTDNEPTSKTHGHRLVYVSLKEQRAGGRFLVNLTTRDVSH